MTEFTREQLEEALDYFQEKHEEKKREAENWREKALKNKAELKNYKKEEERRLEEANQQGKRELSEELLEVMDNLERAIISADEDSEILQGVKMVSDQLYSKLSQEGLERIEAEGEEFDPQMHKAVDKKEAEKDGVVLEQRRPGYRHGEKVLRPAEVVVAESKD